MATHARLGLLHVFTLPGRNKGAAAGIRPAVWPGAVSRAAGTGATWERRLSGSARQTPVAAGWGHSRHPSPKSRMNLARAAAVLSKQ